MKREQIEREIREEVTKKLEGKHVQVDAVLIREVHLSPTVQSAIQTKLAESPNSKVIIVGSGKNALPVIVNTATSSPTPIASAAPGGSSAQQAQ